MTLNEIIKFIQVDKPIRATTNDSSNIKIDRYIPYIYMSIHDGRNLRTEPVYKEISDKQVWKKSLSKREDISAFHCYLKFVNYYFSKKNKKYSIFLNFV